MGSSHVYNNFPDFFHPFRALRFSVFLHVLQHMELPASRPGAGQHGELHDLRRP